jgi:hypothetical protein
MVKNALFRPPTLFCLRNDVKNVTTFSARSSVQKIYQGVSRRRMFPLVFGGFEGCGNPCIANKILDLFEAKNDPRSIKR